MQTLYSPLLDVKCSALQYVVILEYSTFLVILDESNSKVYRSRVTHYNSETVILYSKEFILNNSNK